MSGPRLSRSCAIRWLAIVSVLLTSAACVQEPRALDNSGTTGGAGDATVSPEAVAEVRRYQGYRYAQLVESPSGGPDLGSPEGVFVLDPATSCVIFRSAGDPGRTYAVLVGVRGTVEADGIRRGDGRLARWNELQPANAFLVRTGVVKDDPCGTAYVADE